MKKFKIPCVIFAGGASKRMGRDKSLLPFGSFKTLTQYQLTKFEEFFEHIYISAKDEQKFVFRANVIKDKTDLKIHSPLVGLLSVFEKLENEYVFIISVDTPFFTINEFKKLYNRIPENFEAIVAKENLEIHPMCAIYKKTITPVITKMIDSNEYKLKELLNKINSTYVEYQTEKAFLNLNYETDYERAKNDYMSSFTTL